MYSIVIELQSAHPYKLGICFTGKDLQALLGVCQIGAEER